MKDEQAKVLAQILMWAAAQKIDVCLRWIDLYGGQELEIVFQRNDLKIAERFRDLTEVRPWMQQRWLLIAGRLLAKPFEFKP